MNKNQSIIAIVICLLIFSGCAIFLNFTVKKYKKLKANGVETIAKVINIDKRRSGSTNNKVSYRYFINYSFIDKHGKKVKGGHFINDKDVNHYRTLGKIKITYLPDNPKNNQSSESLANKKNGILFVAIFFFIMGFCVIGFVVNVKNLLKS